MKKFTRIAMSAILMVSLTGCGFDGSYRYSCQDPANWDKTECNPPVCEPSGTCTRDIVGKAIWDEYQKTKVNNG